VSGGIHVSILPTVIDINASKIIGVVMALCSVILINGVLRGSSHITPAMNRSE